MSLLSRLTQWMTQPSSGGSKVTGPPLSYATMPSGMPTMQSKEPPMKTIDLDMLMKAITAVAPSAAPHWTSTLAPFMEEAAITSAGRIAAFVGQMSVESGHFTVLSEDLNYSAARLFAVFPNRFPSAADAAKVAAQGPQAVAQAIYGFRMGNDNLGDAYRFRGGGLIQLTGRDNYEAFAAHEGMTPEAAADYVRTPEGAADSACWFWETRNLNQMADGWQITLMSRKINGGDNGLGERLSACNRALRAVA